MPPAALSALPSRPLLTAAATIGAVAAGAALIEAALIPGMLIGGAAVLAPRLFARRPRPAPARAIAGPPAVIAAAKPRGKLGVKQAVAKTITFRIIVTSLDFTTNYIVIGELGTAAGLSAFSLVVGPLFYFTHEAAWNRFGPEVKHQPGLFTTAINLPAGRQRFTISRALAKTITFRAIATTMDFTTNYVVTRDLATAVILTSTGFILGPFVYLGHEMAWDRFGPTLDAKPA